MLKFAIALGAVIAVLLAGYTAFIIIDGMRKRIAIINARKRGNRE